MVENDRLIFELGNKVKDKSMTWAEASHEYNLKTGENLGGEAFRGRYRRLDIDAVSSSESHNESGIVEVSKDMYEFDSSVIKGPEDILKLFGYDIEKWEVVSWTIGKYEVAIKDEDKNRVCTTVRAKIKPRKIEMSLIDYVNVAKKVFSEEFKGYTPRESNKLSGLRNDRLVLIPQIEAHLGKVSESIDTGVVYNHEIVKDRVGRVFESALEIQDREQADTCLIVIGGDFFNSESNSMTTGGTPQNNDLMYKSMFNEGLELYLNGIMSLRDKFNNVEVIPCVGNHSRAMEFFLYMALMCYFKNDCKVHFSDSYKDTQAYTFGSVGLFFNHGDPNMKRLIGSIPAEFYREYGKTKYRYLFLGHLHKLEQINSENGLTIHRVPAVCENDSWHYMNRFGIGNVPAHEVIVFDKNCGMLSNNYVYFEDMKKGKVKNLHF